MNYAAALAIARDAAVRAGQLVREELHRLPPEPFWPVDALLVAERLLLGGRKLSVGR